MRQWALMPPIDPLDITASTSPPFDRLEDVRQLAADRTGRGSGGHGRHGLYAARDSRTSAHVLIKVTARPGLVYERNLDNEIASLTRINQELASSPYFPVIKAHGRLSDGRVYVITTLFDEFPLARAIGTEREPARMVAHLRTAIEIARALDELHRLEIFHADLNPMNILYRADKGQPVIRIVDFESSYDVARHSSGAFYDPPTTPDFSAPEVSRQAPDARADLFSLGATLYTMLAGYGWTWAGAIGTTVESDGQLDPELKAILLSSVNADPDRRYPSIHAFQVAVAAYLEAIWPGRSW